MKKGFGFMTLGLLLSLLIMSCGGDKKTKSTDDTTTTEEETTVKESTAIAEINIDMVKGEEIYNKYCHVCHKDGIAGAPKIGNRELWGPRAEKGMATLIKHVTEGYTGETGIMPLKGTCMECEEDDFRNAISFLLSKADLTAK